MLNDVLDDRGAKPRHTVGEPPGHAPAMQRQIGCSRPFHIRDCIETAQAPRERAVPYTVRHWWRLEGSIALRLCHPPTLPSCSLQPAPAQHETTIVTSGGNKGPGAIEKKH